MIKHTYDPEAHAVYIMIEPTKKVGTLEVKGKIVSRKSVFNWFDFIGLQP